jgi:lipid-A-disaccharide synthase
VRYFLIAGEASGDLHASNLMKALKAEDPAADFCFLGGDLMVAQGGKLVRHYRYMAFMGIIPVLKNLDKVLGNLKACEEAIRDFRPDAVILIDYPSFNLKIAKFVKKSLHLPVYYYISPKIWAWKKYRIKSIKKYIDRMFCILPFEREFYAKLDYKIDYVGNPSVDSVAAYKDRTKGNISFFREENELGDRPIMALLAGSRKQELTNNLPMMLRVAAKFPEYIPVIAGAPGLESEDYAPFVNETDAKIVFGKTYDLLQNSSVAIVTSGTATLETALFRIPQVVCYKVGLPSVSSFVFDHFFPIKYISLVNLIAGREVVKELFAKRFTEEEITNEVRCLTSDVAYRDEMIKNYDRIIEILGNPGASVKAARLIYEAVKSNH